MMQTIVIGRGRRSVHRRRINPREGVVRKPGEGFLIAAMLCLVGAAVLAIAIALLLGMASRRTPLATVESFVSEERSAASVASDGGDALRQAVRVVDACPGIRPFARRLTRDRAFGIDDLAMLKRHAVEAGCTKG